MRDRRRGEQLTTQKECESAKPVNDRATVYQVADVPGLILRASSRGYLFAVWYRVKGSGAKGLWSLGRVEDGLTLAQARDDARDILRDARKGIDPRIALAEKQAVERKRAADAISVLEVVSRYLESRKKGSDERGPLAPLTVKDYERVRDVYLAPDPVASIPATEVRRADVRAFLDKLTTERGPSIARSVNKVMRSAFSWAEADELIPDDRLYGLKVAKSKPRKRVLEDRELLTFWKALDKAPSLVAAVFRLQLLTAVRYPSELLRAEWSHVDLDARRWKIPAELRKRGIPHELPLSDMAVRVFRKVEPVTREDGDRVFGPLLKRSQTDGWFEKAKTAVLTEHKGAPLVAHDIRRTVADRMVELGLATWPVADAVLGHRPNSPSARAYIHTLPMPEMAAALERWGRHVEGLVIGKPVEGAEIVPIGGRQ